MTILVLGGNGKTSSALSTLLEEKGIPLITASRTPSNNGSRKHIKFDWLDDSTYDLPFQAANDPITAIYMVAPQISDPFPSMKAFIDHARGKGTKRFVLLSASVIPKGGPVYGKVHEYLETLGVEYGVLRPSWFMDNFIDESSRHLRFHDNLISSATQKGRVPFVATSDIAAMAFHLLTDEKAHDTDYFVRGPELLSYDEVAQIISEVTGKPINHEHMSLEDLEAKFSASEMPQEYAKMLAGLDGHIAKGLEAELDDAVLRVTGNPPKSFRAFAQENREKLL
ncbi:hypothetical protein LTR84_003457 [Exophiala bonariae]|uniref:NmrA-like domain-containing protein n=1 Tax=Exophiala bonariae TaxID=1690606 RepID=A0AAV9N7B9_9EURO|nr:hypothetical protein LTR84_003457 [Exophiala bonariae]